MVRARKTTIHTRLARLVATLVVLAVPLTAMQPAGATPRSAAGTSRVTHHPACQAPAKETFLITGRIHACGTSLVDAAHHRVRLLSYELLTLYGGEGDLTPQCGHWYLPPADLPGHLQDWGMNSVQIMLSWANLEPTAPTTSPSGRLVHHWDPAYLSAVDQLIADFHANGIAVALSLGQSRWSPAFQNLPLPNGSFQPCGVGMPTWLYPSGGGIAEMVQAEKAFFAGTDGVQAKFRGVWQMLARRYLHNSAVVGAEMMFEAYDMVAIPFEGHRTAPKVLDLAGFYEKTGNAIHAVAPGLLAIYADWLSRPPAKVVWAITRKPKLKNAAYSFEFYASNWESGMRQRFERFHQRTVDWNVPGWSDEWDAFHYGGRLRTGVVVDPHWWRDTKALLATSKTERMGWSFLGAVDDPLAAVLRKGH